MKRYRDTDYHINELGEIFRYGRKLKPYLNNRGYTKVTISSHGVRIKKFVHRLVMEVYSPDYNEKLQVNHINGEKTDNRLQNLECVSPKINQRHSYDVLRKSRTIKLNSEEVDFIRTNYQFRHKEFGQKPLSKKFNVSQNLIWKILNNLCWIDENKNK